MFRQSRWQLFLIIPFGIIFLMVAAMLVIGAHLLASAVPSQAETDFYQYRTKTMGTVTYSDYFSYDHVGDDGKTEPEDAYRVGASYKVNAQEYEVKGVFSVSKPIGSQLEVFYNLHNPSQSSFDEPLPPVVNTVMNLIIGGVLTIGALIFIGAPVYYLFLRDRLNLTWRRKKARPDKIARESRPPDYKRFPK